MDTAHAFSCSRAPSRWAAIAATPPNEPLPQRARAGLCNVTARTARGGARRSRRVGCPARPPPPVVQDGKALGLDIARGHPVVIAMFYGTCRASCPIIVSDIKAIERQLTPAEQDTDLRVLLVSFDADRDTPSSCSGSQRNTASMRRGGASPRPPSQEAESLAACWCNCAASRKASSPTTPSSRCSIATEPSRALRGVGPARQGNRRPPAGPARCAPRGLSAVALLMIFDANSRPARCASYAGGWAWSGGRGSRASARCSSRRPPSPTRSSPVGSAGELFLAGRRGAVSGLAFGLGLALVDARVDRDHDDGPRADARTTVRARRRRAAARAEGRRRLLQSHDREGALHQDRPKNYAGHRPDSSSVSTAAATALTTSRRGV